MIHVSSLAQNKPEIPGTKRNSLSFFHENHVFSKDQKKLPYYEDGFTYGFLIFPGLAYKRLLGEDRKHGISVSGNYLYAFYYPPNDRNHFQAGDTYERMLTTASLAWHYSLVRSGSLEVESSVGILLRERVDFVWYPGMGFHSYMSETYLYSELGAFAGVQLQRYFGEHFMLYGAAHASRVFWRKGNGEPSDNHNKLTRFGISYRVGIGYAFGEGLPIPERE
ncbi:MAG: hypothetical protein WEC59_06375 [Salibacteraceae bacterium]